MGSQTSEQKLGVIPIPVALRPLSLTSYPLSRPLDEHDLINIDVTVFLNGYHGDNSATFLLPLVVSQYLSSPAFWSCCLSAFYLI